MCGVNVKYDLKGKKLHLLKKNVKKKKKAMLGKGVRALW